MRCGGLVVRVPATISACSGFESRPEGPPHRAVRGAADRAVNTV